MTNFSSCANDSIPGLRTSLTLGSGWPSGGSFSRDVRPLEVLQVRNDVQGPMALSRAIPEPQEPGWVGRSNGLFPVIGSFGPPFELLSVAAVPIVDGFASPPVVGTPVDITRKVANGKVAWNVPDGRHAVFFSFRHRVDQLVVGGAFPSAPAAHVIDHLDAAATETWLQEQGEAWLSALEPLVPDEVFVDSFELVGELPWSDKLAARFAADKGYSLLPNLALVARADGEAKYAEILQGKSGPLVTSHDGSSARMREDYEDVRGALFLESFVEPVARFGRKQGTLLRLQGHGGYAHVLDAYAKADIPESEGLFAAGSMDFLELAASAAHVSGQRVASSESFVAVSPLGPRLSEGEMWMLAGRAYTAGIQRLVFHGVAYPYVRSNGSRWFPFHPDVLAGVVSAGPFDITSDIRPDEPAFAFLSDFNHSLTRLSYAMTRGEDRAEVAWLLDESELPDASFIRGVELSAEQEESETSLQLRRAGYRYDRISPSMLASSTAADGKLLVGRAVFRAVLVTDWPAANPEELDALARALEAGVPVVGVGALPARARGLADRRARDKRVAATRAAIHDGLTVVADASAIAPALSAAAVLPDIQVGSTDCDTVSLAHREASNGHLFLVFHEHPRKCEAELHVRTPGSRAALLDPRDGSETPLAAADKFTVSLPAQRPLVVFVER